MYRIYLGTRLNHMMHHASVWTVVVQKYRKFPFSAEKQLATKDSCIKCALCE